MDELNAFGPGEHRAHFWAGVVFTSLMVLAGFFYVFYQLGGVT